VASKASSNGRRPREAVAKVLRDAFGAWIGAWSDDGEANNDQMPF
jgi:hypothetical protein